MWYMRACVYVYFSRALCTVSVSMRRHRRRRRLWWGPYRDTRQILQIIYRMRMLIRVYGVRFVTAPCGSGHGGDGGDRDRANSCVRYKRTDIASIDIEIEPQIRTSIRANRDGAIPVGES